MFVFRDLAEYCLTSNLIQSNAGVWVNRQGRACTS